MSGGGRCNFTNIYAEPDNFFSENPHFCKSALARYTPWDFIAMVSEHGVPYHEKKLGQLFCDNKSRDIRDMLLDECERAGVALRLNTSVRQIEKTDAGYALDTDWDHIALAVGGGRHRRPVDPDAGRHRLRLRDRSPVRPQRGGHSRWPGAVHPDRPTQGPVHTSCPARRWPAS